MPVPSTDYLYLWQKGKEPGPKLHEEQMVKSAGFATNSVALKGFSLATQIAFTGFPRAIFQKGKRAQAMKSQRLGKITAQNNVFSWKVLK